MAERAAENFDLIVVGAGMAGAALALALALVPGAEVVLLVLALVLAGAGSPLAWSALHAAGSSSAGRRGGA